MAHARLWATQNESKNQTLYLVTKAITVDDQLEDLSGFTACVADEKEFAAFLKKKDAMYYAASILFHDQRQDENKPWDPLKIYVPVLTAKIEQKAPPASVNYEARDPVLRITKQLVGSVILRDQIKSISAIDHHIKQPYLMKNEQNKTYSTVVPEKHIEFPPAKTPEFLAGTLQPELHFRLFCTIL
jgi:hypothetical protein